MIGFDRPLKPEWIYETLKIIQPGMNLYSLKESFEKICWERKGDGRRKVLTVLARYFLPTEKNDVIKESLVILLSKKLTIDEIKPLLFFVLIAKSEPVKFIINNMTSLYQLNERVNVLQLRRMTEEKYGESWGTQKTYQSIIQTLKFFGILSNTSEWKSKFDVSKLMTIHFLKIYSDDYIRSPQVDLQYFEEMIKGLYVYPDLKSLALEYSGKLWDLQRKLNKDLLVLRKNFEARI